MGETKEEEQPKIANYDWAALKAPFPEHELEWRALRSGMSGKGPWAAVAPYVSARAVQDRLDDVIGPGNYDVEPSPIRQYGGGGGIVGDEPSGNIIGYKNTITIYMSQRADRYDGPSRSRTDVSELTDIEPLKGGVSKSLVRTGVLWGIGRYLYSMPRMFAQFAEKREARYSAKIDGKMYYWNPPRVPKEFLP